MATTTTSTPATRDPTTDEALALFKAIEEKFPARALGDDKWYLLAVSLIHPFPLPQSTPPRTNPPLTNVCVKNVACSHSQRRPIQLRALPLQTPDCAARVPKCRGETEAAAAHARGTV